MSDQYGNQPVTPNHNADEDAGIPAQPTVRLDDSSDINQTIDTAYPTGTPSEKDGDLGRELREMGQQLESAFRTVLESDRARQIQRDLSSGVQEIFSQLQVAVKRLQSDPRVQQAEERGRDLLSQAQQSKAVADLQETLTTGFAQLNAQLRKAVDRIESNLNQYEPDAADTVQRVTIEQEPPAAPATEHLTVETDDAAGTRTVGDGTTRRLDDTDRL